jgi:hypothetical protein|uniref:Putative terminase n=1 Tax=viral metagenome TaxID=1070528 RepID=A0A6H1ZAX8_9ZZZZ
MRPTDYSQDVVSAILERLSDGESLRKICDDEAMPARSTVFLWLSRHKEFSDQYTYAREAQADALFDDALAIADTPMIGEKRKVKDDGGIEIMTGDMIEHRRLQVDTRKWMAGKLRPKKYGERLELEHGGQVALVPTINLNAKSS